MRSLILLAIPLFIGGCDTSAPENDTADIVERPEASEHPCVQDGTVSQVIQDITQKSQLDESGITLRSITDQGSFENINKYRCEGIVYLTEKSKRGFKIGYSVQGTLDGSGALVEVEISSELEEAFEVTRFSALLKGLSDKPRNSEAASNQQNSEPENTSRAVPTASPQNRMEADESGVDE